MKKTVNKQTNSWFVFYFYLPMLSAFPLDRSISLSSWEPLFLMEFLRKWDSINYINWNSISQKPQCSCFLESNIHQHHFSNKEFTRFQHTYPYFYKHQWRSMTASFSFICDGPKDVKTRETRTPLSYGDEQLDFYVIAWSSKRSSFWCEFVRFRSGCRVHETERLWNLSDCFRQSEYLDHPGWYLPTW